MGHDSKSGYWGRFWTTRTSRRRQLQYMAAGGIGVAGAAIVGCGDDDDDDASPTSPPTGGTTAPGATATTAGPTATPTEAVKRGGRLKTIYPANFIHLDFHQSITANTLGPTGVFAQTLLRYSYDSPSSQVVEGYLASEYEQPDNETFILTMDPRAKWHDIAPVSGRAVDSEDVKANFERILNPANNIGLIRHIGDFVGTVDAANAGTVRLNLKREMAGLEKILGSCFIYMMPKEGATGAYDQKVTPIGSGPFIVKSFEAGAGITFDRNTSYWKPDLPYVDGVDHTIVSDVSQAFNALIIGDASVGNVTYTQLATLQQRNPKAVVSRYPISTANALWMPDREGSPYKDLRLRQAIKYAIDQDEIIERLYNGTENAFFTGNITQASPDIMLPEAELRQIYGHDLPRAQALMSEMGITSVTLPVIISTQQGGQIMSDLIQIIQSQVAKIGITFEVQDLDSVTGNATVLNPTIKDYGAAFYRNTANSGGDELDWLYKGYARNGLYNFTQDDVSVDNELQQMISDMVGEFDKEARLKLVYDIQRRIGETAISIPSPATYNNHAHQENVRGYAPHNSEFFGTSTRKFEEVWLA